jgi:hypothetical protein
MFGINIMYFLNSESVPEVFLPLPIYNEYIWIFRNDMWEIITKFQPQNLNWKTQKAGINGNIILKWILEEYHTDRIQLTQEKAASLGHISQRLMKCLIIFTAGFRYLAVYKGCFWSHI